MAPEIGTEMKCARCGKPVLCSGYRQQYCTDCKEIVKKENRKRYKSAIKENGTTPPVRYCEMCGAPMERYKKKYCAKCGDYVHSGKLDIHYRDFAMDPKPVKLEETSFSKTCQYTGGKKCPYWCTANGGNGGIRFCHFLLITGKSRRPTGDTCKAWEVMQRKRSR